jgi:hypothetical protein
MRTILRIEILLVASYIPGRRVRAEGEVLQWDDVVAEIHSDGVLGETWLSCHTTSPKT